MSDIKKGSIVKYDNSWYRVTYSTKNTVNLGSIFGGKIYHKGVSRTDVIEDEKNWYEYWSKTETYQSM